MKKMILVLCAVLAVLAVCALIFVQPGKRKVSDFNLFPCEYGKADTVQIEREGRQHVLVKDGIGWRLISPVQEVLAWDTGVEMNSFMASKMFVDDKRINVTPQERERLGKTVMSRVTFKRGGNELCTMELGQGTKLPTVDSERRWVFMGNDAYRAFIPLLDFGPLLEQPLAGWRHRDWTALTTSSIDAIRIWTSAESFALDRQGVKSQSNPQGWRIAEALVDQNPIDVQSFALDERRVATIVDLVTPFMVDDWGDFISDEERAAIQYGGELKVTAAGTDYLFRIGSEVDLNRHPEYSWIGSGARFIKKEGDERPGIISSQRMSGLFPALNDMRSKNVWKLDSTRFSAIETQVGQACIRYVPKMKDVWMGTHCVGLDDGSSGGEQKTIKNEMLGNFVKVLTSLQAVRYVPSEELSSVEPGSAEIRIYLNQSDDAEYRLKLSDCIRNMFRYAQIESLSPQGATLQGPVFAISEDIAHYLLSDLTSL